MFVYAQITSGGGSTSWSFPSRQWPNATTRGDNAFFTTHTPTVSKMLN